MVASDRRPVMRKLLVGLAVLALSACATAQKLGAANDVHALLVSIRDNDSAAFDAHVDHEALKAELHAKLEEQLGKNKKMKDLGALLGPSTLDIPDKLLVQPKTF